MSMLVDDMLLLARLDQGRPLETQPVDLQAIARDAVADAHAVAPQREITLNAPSSVVVTGDDTRLRQAVGNLVRNALVHTPPETPIEVGVGADDGIARITVVDHGPGLEAGRRRADLRAVLSSRPEPQPRQRRRRPRAVDRGRGGRRPRRARHREGDAGGGATFEVELPAGPPQA